MIDDTVFFFVFFFCFFFLFLFFFLRVIFSFPIVDRMWINWTKYKETNFPMFYRHRIPLTCGIEGLQIVSQIWKVGWMSLCWIDPLIKIVKESFIPAIPLQCLRLTDSMTPHPLLCRGISDRATHYLVVGKGLLKINLRRFLREPPEKWVCWKKAVFLDLATASLWINLPNVLPTNVSWFEKWARNVSTLNQFRREINI